MWLDHFQGSRSSTRLILSSGMHADVSASHPCGLTPISLAGLDQGVGDGGDTAASRRADGQVVLPSDIPRDCSPFRPRRQRCLHRRADRELAHSFTTITPIVVGNIRRAIKATIRNPRRKDRCLPRRSPGHSPRVATHSARSAVALSKRSREILSSRTAKTESTATSAATT